MVSLVAFIVLCVSVMALAVSQFFLWRRLRAEEHRGGMDRARF